MAYIYKLNCNGKSYVGSTKNIKKRIQYHKADCKHIGHKNYNFKVYKFIRENGGWENVDICILQVCNEDVRYIVEDFYIKHYKCELNDVSAIFDVEKRKEYKKKYGQTYFKPYYKNNKEKILQNVKNYYNNNKEKVLKYQKEYGEKNKERLSEKKKEKYNCVCGSSLRKADKKRHERSNKHQTYLASLS
jgi:hypothetical protein